MITKPASTEELDQLRQELERARQRLGSPKDRLEWFLNFAEMDLKRLSRTELELLHYMILAAAGLRIPKGQQPVKSIRAIEYTPSTLTAYQREIKTALRDLFETGVWKCPGNVRIEVRRTSPNGAKECAFEVGWTYRSEKGAAMRGFTYALRKAGEYLRSCARCGKIFVATKRQEYCTANCSQIVRNEKKKRIKEAKAKTPPN